jgi:hypothetical protein
MQQQGAAPEDAAPLGDPGAGGEGDLRDVGRRNKSQSLRHGEQGAAGGPFLPDEGAVRQGHAALEDAVLAPGDDIDRQRVEQLVGDDHAAEAFGQGVEPGDAVGEMRHAAGESVLLARAQLAGELEDLVALGQRAAALELQQQADGEGAAAGACFEEARRAGSQDLRHLGRQGIGRTGARAPAR